MAANNVTVNGGQNGTENGEEEKDLTYVSYLELDKLLDCVHLRTAKFMDKPVHDEHLFITVHQAYEVWFKQVIFEIDSIADIFSKDSWQGNQLVVLNRVDRINLIMKLVIGHLEIMETLNPLSFYEFRNYLFPASGFQSHQFRIIENKIGIKPDWRIQYQKKHYASQCDPNQRTKISQAEEEATILTLVERWLENTCGLAGEFNFMEKFPAQVKAFLRETYKFEPAEPDEEKTEPEKAYDSAKKSWDNIVIAANYEKLRDSGDAKMSHGAVMGALLISHYRHDPRFQQSYQLLKKLIDLDAIMNKWRYHHVLMVQRFIGAKPGTGGSSGYQYLRSTISERYKVFLDLFNLSNYFLPSEYLPALPQKLN